MLKNTKLPIAGCLCALLTVSSVSAAERAATVAVTAEPARYAAVSGYRQLFEAHHWMNGFYDGGIREFETMSKLPDDLTLRTEGRALFNNDDYLASVRIDKEDRGYVLISFDGFRKYYPNKGGAYYPFSSFSSPALSRDLSVEIQKLRLESGVILENLPDLKFIYEHESKAGDKSRLTWAAVVEGGITRNIAPSFQEIDETVDIFELEAEDTFQGWEWKASQKWEVVESDSMREERSLSTGTTASQKKIRNHSLDLDAALAETVFSLEKWFLKDTLFTGHHYRYAQIENSEIEQILEMNENRVPTTFANPHQVADSPSTNQFVSHTWVGHVLYYFTKQLSLGAKLKAENIVKNGQSTLNNDNAGAAPDGRIDRMDVSNNDNKIGRMGESLSLRYSGIPRTALYIEGEAEQTRNWLSENRQSTSAGEQVDREVLAHLNRWAGTIGGQIQPWKGVKATTHYRRRYDDVDYNNIRYPRQTATAAKSVFIEAQDSWTDEIATKLTWRPVRWFEPSARYQFRDKVFATEGSSDDQNQVEGEDISNTYTLEATFYPDDKLITTLGASYQDAQTITGARDVVASSGVYVPKFESDVLSLLGSVSYVVSERLRWTGSTLYSFAGNYDDFAARGLPLGASYNQFDLTVGYEWKWKPNVTVAPKYAFYGYWPTEEMENEYNAHVVWVDFKIQWG